MFRWVAGGGGVVAVVGMVEEAWSCLAVCDSSGAILWRWCWCTLQVVVGMVVGMVEEVWSCLGICDGSAMLWRWRRCTHQCLVFFR